MCSGSLNSNIDKYITFSNPFQHVPVVTATITTSEELPKLWGYNTINVADLTNSGFRAGIHSLDNSNRNMRICWIAVSLNG